MAYASPSPIRAPYAQTRPGQPRPDEAAARVDPSAALNAAPRDAFKEKAEREAKRKAEKEARRKPLAAPALAADLASAPAPKPGGFASWANTSPKSRPASPRPKPKLVSRSAEPAAAPSLRTGRAKPVFTVHVNPAPVAAAPFVMRPLGSSAPGVAPSPTKSAAPPPGPGPAAAAAPPVIPLPSKRGGGGGGSPPKPPANPAGVEKEKVIDRDLLVGGALSSLLLLFFGWNLFGGTKGHVAAAPSPEPVLKVASAPKPDAFPSGEPVELRPQTPLPSASPMEEASAQAPPVAPTPEVKVAQAPPAKLPPVAGSACDRVKMVKAYFCTASSELSPDMRSVLEKQLTDWKACLGGSALVVRGYADTRGQSAYNTALSTARADTLRDLLKSHDVKVAEAEGEGELPGLADNQNCPNQRRVDISIGDAQPSAECARPKDAPALSCG